MFSSKEKQHIASKIENILLSIDHPEMPKEKPEFTLFVKGKESWSYAQIEPNWKFNEYKKPGVNFWNEIAREVME